MRRGAVSAYPVKSDIDLIGSCHTLPLGKDHRTRRQRRGMHRDECIGNGKLLELGIIRHRTRPFDELFGRLCDEDQGPLPFILVLFHRLGDPQQPCGVCIMPARMHHRNTLPIPTLDHLGAGIRQSCGLFDRIGIHIGTVHHDRTFAVLQHPCHTGLADPRDHFIAKLFQLIGDDPGGLRLHKPQLRVLVYLLEGCQQVCSVRFDTLLHSRRNCCIAYTAQQHYHT